MRLGSLACPQIPCPLTPAGETPGKRLCYGSQACGCKRTGCDVTLEPLIQLTRGGLQECLHFGSVAVVNTRGKLLSYVGNAHLRTFSRSTLKALQALPFVEAGGPAQFGFTQPEVAMLCASHNGEDAHVAGAESMLGKAGLSYRTLRCGCHVPGLFTLLDQAPPEGLEFDERHNNCSGKHAGFLAHCVQQGWPTEDYVAVDHPLQQAIRRDVARAVGMDEEDLKLGIDGCSAPNYASPCQSWPMAMRAWPVARQTRNLAPALPRSQKP